MGKTPCLTQFKGRLLDCAAVSAVDFLLGRAPAISSGARSGD